MTLWEFSCALEGLRLANGDGTDASAPMNGDRLAELGVVGF